MPTDGLYEHSRNQSKVKFLSLFKSVKSGFKTTEHWNWLVAGSYDRSAVETIAAKLRLEE